VDLHAALATDFTIDLTTIGRRSGLPRRIEIWYLFVDDTPFVTGTPGPRDWFANILSDSSIVFHLKKSIQADIPGVAEVIDDPELRHRVFHAPNSDWYRSMASIDRLVSESPMIRCDLDLALATFL